MSIWSLLTTSWVRSQRFLGHNSRSLKRHRRAPHHKNNPWQVSLGLESLEDRTLLSSSLGVSDYVWNSALVDFAGDDLTGKDGRLANVGLDMSLLYNEYQAYEQSGSRDPFVSSNSLFQVYNGYVVVDVTFDSDADAMVHSLSQLGMFVTGTWGHVASGFLPIDSIDNLVSLSGMRSAAGAAAMTNVGSVTTQGDAAQYSDVARLDFGIDGSGITVGVLSDSFNALGGYATDVATGDLPNNVNVLSDYTFGGSDEGRAMAQLVADVAPGADLAFHSAFYGQADFASGIIDLANAGADVIVDDVFYYAEPYFQDGIIAQAIDEVVSRGVSYFSSAGNDGRHSYESVYRNSGIDLGPSGMGLTSFDFIAHDFDPGPGVDIYQTVTLNGSVLGLQWDDPFYSVSGGAGALTDMDLAIFDMDGNLIYEGVDYAVGGDPYELLSGIYGQVQIAIGKFEGPDPTLIKYIVFDNGAGFSALEYDTDSGTAVGHNNAAGAASVGAAYYQDTPVYGTYPPEVEYFSSAGGTPILFDTSGNRLTTPEYRNTPDFVAPDGGNTTFFGYDSDSDGFPNFFGTSAAAPHAAAVAALMLDAVGGSGMMTPEEQYSVLRSTAIDMDDPATAGFDYGYDFGTGYGLINARDAIDTAIQLIQAPPLADAGGPYVFGVRDTIQLDGSGSFDRNQPNDSLTYRWDFDNDGIYDATGIRPDMSVAYLHGQTSSVVRLMVIDDEGNYDTDLARVYLEDTAVLRIRGDYQGVVGQRRVISLKLYGPTVTHDEYTYIVDWGDGSKERVVSGISGLSISKIYNKTGNFTIHATAISNETGLVTSHSRVMRIRTVLQDGDDFAFTGTSGDDYMRVYTRPGTDQVEIYLNRVSLGVHTVPGTIYAIGMDGDDWFVGDDGTYDVYFDAGRGQNVAYTYGGNDTLLGREGRDRFYDDGGNNYIDAGDGDNRITTATGNDTIKAGSGSDKIIDLGGNNKIYAGDGNNYINTRRGNDTIIAGSGGDRVSDDGGNNYIELGDGSNVLRSGWGNDTILGGAQDDSIEDGGGYNYIYTFASNDLIVDYGNSYIDSGTGNDLVIDYEDFYRYLFFGNYGTNDLLARMK